MKKQKEIRYVDRRCRDSFVPKKLKEAFGWRQIGVAEKTKSWIDDEGKNRYIKKKYCVMRRVRPYSRNLIFVLTELAANILNFLRAVLWALLIPILLLLAITGSDFTTGIIPLEPMSIAVATTYAFLAVYAGCYACILLGNLERKLFRIDKKYAAKNYAAQSGSFDLKVDIRILEDKRSFWRQGVRKLQTFGWKVYDDISLETEMLFTRWEENEARKARNAEKIQKYEEMVDNAFTEYGVRDDLIYDAKERYLDTLESLDNTIESDVVCSYYTAMVRPVKFNKAVKLLQKLDQLFLVIRNLGIIATAIIAFYGLNIYPEWRLFLPISAAVWGGSVVLRMIFAIIARVLRIGSEDEAWFEALNLPISK